MKYTLTIKFKPEVGDERMSEFESELDADPLNLSPGSIPGKFIGVSEDQIVQFELDLEHAWVKYKSKTYRFDYLDRSGAFVLRRGW
jgi:hypothetical protein